MICPYSIPNFIGKQKPYLIENIDMHIFINFNKECFQDYYRLVLPCFYQSLNIDDRLVGMAHVNWCWCWCCGQWPPYVPTDSTLILGNHHTHFITIPPPHLSWFINNQFKKLSISFQYLMIKYWYFTCIF